MICMMAVAVCSPANGQAQHCEIEVKSKNRSAETLTDVLKPYIDKAKLSVVHDLGAVLYLEGEVANHIDLFHQLQKSLPEDSRVVRVENLRHAIPEPPEQKETPMIEYMILDEQAKRYGITNEAIFKHMEQLDLPSEKGLKELKTATIKSPDGNLVPLESLIEVRQSTLKRPLIFQN